MTELIYVADFYRRYPSEPLTFHICLKISEPISSGTVQVTLPNKLSLTEIKYNPSGFQTNTPFYSGNDNNSIDLQWEISDLEIGTYEYCIETVIPIVWDGQFLTKDIVLESQAKLTLQYSSSKSFQQSQTVQVVVYHKAKAIEKFLPSIYHDDSVLGRYLMFFENLWQPIENRIENIDAYFDPLTTPPDFLRWLASWVNYVWDDNLPEESGRYLIREMMVIYHQRGTKFGLRRHLQLALGIFDDEEAEKSIDIQDNPPGNFTLTDDTTLTDALILGTIDEIYSFTVQLNLPPNINHDEGNKWEKIATSIIIANKPAHTTYNLRIKR